MNNPLSEQLFPRWALAVWLTAAAALAFRTLLSPDTHTAFPIFAASSLHYWSDHPLYGNYKPLDYFRYPPVFAVAITPLALLGHCLGGILWSWLGLAVYGAGVWRLLRDVLPERDWSRGRQSAFLLLALLGALPGLWNAQSNALAMGLLLLGGADLMRRKWWPAAWLLAGSVLLKLTPLAPVLLLCALYPRRLLGRFGFALVVIGLVPFLTGSPSWVLRHYEEWLGHLSGSSCERWPGFRDGWTLWMVIQQMRGVVRGPLVLDAPLASPFYRTLQLLTAGLVLLWCLVRQRQGLGEKRLLTETLTLGTGWLMLFGPSVEHATYAFLAPLLAWALVSRDFPAACRCLNWCGGSLVLVFGWGALSTPLLPWAPWLLAALPLGTAFLMLGLLLATLSDPILLDKFYSAKSPIRISKTFRSRNLPSPHSFCDPKEEQVPT
jgi:Glycosyltransferase family 87